MSKIKDILIDLQSEIVRDEMTYEEIARAYGVSIEWVYDAASLLEEPDFDYAD